MPPPTRRSRRVAVAVALVVAAVAPVGVAAQDGPAPVDPQGGIDPQAQRDVNRQQREQVDADIDLTRADHDDIVSALAELDTRLDRERGALLLAQVEIDRTRAEAAAAEEALEAAHREAEASAAALRQMAIDAYVSTPSDALATVMASDSLVAAHERQSILAVQAQQRSDVLARRKTAVKDLQVREAAAAEAKLAAERAEGTQRQAVSDLESARAVQVELVAGVESRLEAELAEAAALDATDAALARQVEAQAKAVQDQADEVAEKARDPLGGSSTTAPPSSTPGSTTTGPSGTTRPPTTSRPPTTAKPPVTAPPTTTKPVTPSPIFTWSDMARVGPLWVNKLIAPQVRNLLTAATAAGFNLSGGGFRDPASQIALRRAHCGPSVYDIYYRPASECSPPTARPGRSMHEQGLAIDITCNGALITNRSSPCFLWLSMNAARFGLSNLPSEPWHWSINGR